jgi:hypothetical protein
VYVRVYGDDEWRYKYGSTKWQGAAQAAIETADDSMSTQFGIDLRVQSYHNWDTVDCSSAYYGRTRGNVFDEFKDESAKGTGTDVLMGFSAQNPCPGDTSGLAGLAIVGGYQAVIWYQSAAGANWKVTQHETSHLFGNDHASGDAHPNDIMEDIYNAYNRWCQKTSANYYDHWGQITRNAAKFG